MEHESERSPEMTVGQRLRSARLEKQLDLCDVSRTTNIREVYLQRLEEDDYEHFPDSFYALSFLRQYCAALQLDEEEAVAAARPNLPVEAPRPDTEKQDGGTPVPLSAVKRSLSSSMQSSRWSLAGLARPVIAVVLVGAGFAGWYYATQPTPTEPERPVPEGAAQSQEVVAVETEAPVEPEQPLPSETAPETPAAVAPAANGAEAPASPRLDFEFEALDQVWVEWRVDGEGPSEALLQAGERQAVQADSLLEITVGNAAAVNLHLNSETIPDLGQAGQVRHLRITRDGWMFARRPDN